jgi:hypothetical protein
MRKINIRHPLPESINNINVNILSVHVVLQLNVEVLIIFHSKVLLEIHWILHCTLLHEGGISDLHFLKTECSLFARLGYKYRRVLRMWNCVVYEWELRSLQAMFVLIHDSEIKIQGSHLGLSSVVLHICRTWRSYLNAINAGLPRLALFFIPWNWCVSNPSVAPSTKLCLNAGNIKIEYTEWGLNKYSYNSM